jgi:hypothetical protein
MDGGRIAATIGAGLASGIVMLAGIHSTALPFSYMMNRYIYHGPLMRIVAGIIGTVLTVPMFIFLLLNALTFGTLGSFLESYVPKQHYFGLFPLINTGSLSEAWQTSTLLKIVLSVINGITMIWDEGAYIDSIKRVFTLGSKKGVVNEAVFEEARALAAEGPSSTPKSSDPKDVAAAWAEWNRKVAVLSAKINPVSSAAPAPAPPEAEAGAEAVPPEAEAGAEAVPPEAEAGAGAEAEAE